MGRHLLRISPVVWLAVLVLLVLTGIGRAVADEPIDYARQVKPILHAHCFSCHGALQQKSQLRLDAASLIMRGGESGPVIVPGHADKSLLIQSVEGTDDVELMPKEASPLKPAQIAVLRKWINQGAKAPLDEKIPPDPARHWAFASPVRPPVPPAPKAPPAPKGRDARWSANPIDSFLAARHEQAGLTPQPTAARAVLLRRVYLDLIGLPPTPKQLQEFLDDPSSDAYEKVVDRLLLSPQYGERWGRHWMDSDWYGYKKELRSSARHIWRWRDWIIESLNSDKPYDRMIQEMLAGDELAPGDSSVLPATGFLARNYYKFNRNVWLDSTVEHTSKAFMGITMNCVRCHEHKYDPITHAEYYRMRAIFEPHRIRTARVPGQADIKKDGLPYAYDVDLDAKTYIYDRGNDKKPLKDKPITPGVPKVLGSTGWNVKPIDLPAAAYYPGLAEFVQRETLAAADSKLKAGQVAYDKASKALQEAKRKAESSRKKEPAETGGPPAGSIKSKAPAVKPDEQAAGGTLFIEDDFARPKPKVWQTGAGRWQYKNGRLLQTQTGAGRRTLTSLTDHPRNFTARFEFKITGGQQWKSVGLSFDSADNSYQTVYLSAHSGEPKVQISHTSAGITQYPPSGKRRLPIQVGRKHVLRVDMRDRLANVYVDDKLALAYTFPQRRGGKFVIWTFDASAEFISVRINALSKKFSLVTANAKAPVGKATVKAPTPRQALQLADAVYKDAAAQLELARISRLYVQQRIAADKARYSKPRAADADALARKAAGTAGVVELSKAQAAVTSTQKQWITVQIAGKPAKTIADALKKRDAAKKNLQQLKKRRKDSPSIHYAALTNMLPVTSSGRRLALARWLTNRKHPLTARVAVNHIWMRHFGKPLVSSVFDFGNNGKKPTHPKLLDYLAVELMENNWSMKHLHRMMVKSQAYRMTSTGRGAAPQNVQIDRDNQLLWRMNPRRMESEIVRDSLIYVAGNLDQKMGGPDLAQNLGQTTYRRSLYYRHALEKQMTFMLLFDAASPNECYRRSHTVVPQQALALANSPLALDMSRKLAARITMEVGSKPRDLSDRAFIGAAFIQILGRPPSEQEKTHCKNFLLEQARRLGDTGSLSAFSGSGKSTIAVSKDPHQRARENLLAVLFNHHEFVTIR